MEAFNETAKKFLPLYQKRLTQQEKMAMMNMQHPNNVREQATYDDIHSSGVKMVGNSSDADTDARHPDSILKKDLRKSIEIH